MRHGNVNSLLEVGNNMGVGESVIGQRGDVHWEQHCPLGVKHDIPRITFDQGQLTLRARTVKRSLFIGQLMSNQRMDKVDPIVITNYTKTIE